ncbi:MAG: ABC transporter permease/M1 family aminopeptidase [Bacteroidota bacterium]
MMFAKIFKFEFLYWLKNPLFYIYAVIFYLISGLIMAADIGVFDGNTASVVGINIRNSAYAIAGILSGMSILIYFILPSIVGSSIYKDYKYDMHNVLFSYPFKKSAYLFGKFLSSISVVLILMFVVALGIISATILPSANQDLLTTFDWYNYAQPFFIFVIPNIVFYGAIVFGITTFSRNIFAGFISIIVLLIVQAIASSYAGDIDTKHLASLIDPMGMSALGYETEYWTVIEQNTLALPFSNYLLYNRLLWAGISVLIFFSIYKLFKFNQQGFTLKWFNKKGVAVKKRNFGGNLLRKVPQVQLDLSQSYWWKLVWKQSNFQLKYILKNWTFIIIITMAIAALLFVLIKSNSIQGTNTLPMTWLMVDSSTSSLGVFMMLLTFLFTGMLMHRGRLAKMNQLIDTSPAPTWVFMASDFLAIIKMQALFYLSVMVVSIGYQIYNEFYYIEIGLYLVNFFVIDIWYWIIYALLAFFIHSLVKNYIVGFIILITLTILFPLLSSFGVDQSIFIFNRGGGVNYSDMNGFGSSLPNFFTYKIYWTLLGIALFIIGTLFYRRGVISSFKERFKIANNRFNTGKKIALTSSLAIFIAIGSYIYYDDNIRNERKTAKEYEKESVEYEQKFGHRKGAAQPRITDVYVELDLDPKNRNFEARGKLTLVNKTDQPIDSVFVRYAYEDREYSYSIPGKTVAKNDTYNEEVFVPDEPLMPKDSFDLDFNLKNETATFLRTNSPILKNGTFLRNNFLPNFGYNENREISYHKLREKYNLPFKERMKSPTDSTALGNTYISDDADWINFETVISTAPEQIAIAPGYLQKEWMKDNKRYFHYKMESKMLNFFNFMSAEYEVYEEEFNGINIQIFYHKPHDFNIDRMMKGAKKALAYYEENFSPYQFNQLRIIEFPKTMGSFAQAFANTVPYSEGVGFIADVDDENDGVDYPFTITAHEVAHQWFAHQVIGANVRGATMLSESLAEYSSLKVLEKEYGKKKMRRFLKDALNSYLRGRKYESQKELPLILNENQQYIHYNKGSLVMYAMSDYLGEDKFNGVISEYIDNVAFQEPPYTTSLEFTDYLKKSTPDSLQYLITDMYETITLYNNKVVDASKKQLENGNWQVDFEVNVIKYRSDETGNKIFSEEISVESDKEVELTLSTNNGDSIDVVVDEQENIIESLPVADYVEVGIFGEDDESVLYLEKKKFTKSTTSFSIEVEEEPHSVGIDPYNKLIDRKANDNRMDL